MTASRSSRARDHTDAVLADRSPDPPPIRIPVYQPYMTGKEYEYVMECMKSGWISSRGAFVSRFEKDFAKYIGVGHATSVTNGTVALHLALHLLGVGPGDEVIVPTFTYIASVNAIAIVGATPVFVDSLEDSWNLDPADVRAKITPRTKAVMAVHLYGAPCDIGAVSAICREHDLALIEDAAEAFGSKYKGRFVGTFGDIATFSFFGNKTITTGEGGMVVSNNEALIEHAALVKSQAVSKVREYWHDEMGFNFRMTNLAAAIGVAQLEQADPIIEKKRQIASWYKSELQGYPFAFQPDGRDVFNSFWMVAVATPDGALRDAVRAHLRGNGVETRPFFYPAHTMPVFKSSTRYPVAEALGKRGMNLPSYPALTEEQVRSVAALMKECVDGRR